jgi:hypothetical protein
MLDTNDVLFTNLDHHDVSHRQIYNAVICCLAVLHANRKIELYKEPPYPMSLPLFIKLDSFRQNSFVSS